jgi:ketosteroid isomerase-like protein
LCKGLYDAFKAGAIDKVIAGMAADIDWQTHGRPKDFPTIGRWRGPAGAQEFFRLVGESLDVKEFAPHTFAAAADKVIVQGHYRWTVRTTGKPVDSEWCHIFTLKNGKVTEFREFTDTAAFAEAWRG